MPKTVALLVLALAGCPKSTPDVADAPVAPDMPDVALPADAPEVPDMPDVALPADAPEVPDMPDMPDVTIPADAPEVPTIGDPTEIGSPSLHNTRWTLASLDGADATDPRAWFSLGADGSLAGHGGCNRLFGEQIEATDATVRFGNLGATRMACPNLSEEQAFVRMLSEVDGYRLDDATLVLLTADTERASFIIL